MKHVLLVTSARPVSAEMQTEMGQLPPALLPVGDAILLAEQLKRLGNVPSKRYLTLPTTYKLTAWQAKRVQEVGVEVLYFSPELSLGASVLSALETMRFDQDTTLHLIHGDTVLDHFACGAGDRYSVHPTTEAYRWARLQTDRERQVRPADGFVEDSKSLVLSGYFSFSAVKDLAWALERTDGDFIRGIALYAEKHPMIGIQGGEWYDFGHVLTYYASKRAYVSKRAFNTLNFQGGTVTKSGSNGAKIAAEAHWFANAPPALKIFLPQFIDSHTVGPVASYTLEYLNLNTLAEMFVFADTPLARWEQIFASCGEFLALCRSHHAPDAPDTSELFLQKTIERLSQACAARGWQMDAPWTINGQAVGTLREVAFRAASWAEKGRKFKPALMHGDFCFSNILYDFRAHRIKTIDPRGFVKAGEPSVYGDPLYDIAKLYHSAIGLYDLIIAGAFRHTTVGENDIQFEVFKSAKQEVIAEIFRAYILQANGIDERAVAGTAIMLFLSMIPLHYDDPSRQDAFLANALRIVAMHDGQGVSDDRVSHGRFEQTFHGSGVPAAQVHAGGSR